MLGSGRKFLVELLMGVQLEVIKWLSQALGFLWGGGAKSDSGSRWVLD
jgi:hypothetical protein